MTHVSASKAKRLTATEAAHRVKTLIRVTQEDTLVHQTLVSVLDIFMHADLRLGPAIPARHPLQAERSHNRLH